MLELCFYRSKAQKSLLDVILLEIIHFTCIFTALSKKNHRVDCNLFSNLTINNLGYFLIINQTYGILWYELLFCLAMICKQYISTGYISKVTKKFNFLLDSAQGNAVRANSWLNWLKWPVSSLDKMTW